MNKRNKLIHGVGINDANYVAVINAKDDSPRWICPYYGKWRGMLERCYSEKYHLRFPTYKDCSVHPDWLIFSNFKSWMEEEDWKDKHLDKDILIPTNKRYSPENCIFVSGRINMFVTERARARGIYPLGVYYRKSTAKFGARCSNPFTSRKESEHLGLFDTTLEAHTAWKAKKLEHVHTFIEKGYINDDRIKEALIKRYS